MEAIPGEESHAATRALVVAGGDGWSGDLPRIGASIESVIAADSGVELALQLGIPVDVVIGDLDSAAPEALDEAERNGARIDRHPADKDETDLELAMDLACRQGARSIVVIGGGGGRLSHLLGNASLLAGDKYSHVAITWLLPHTEVHVVNQHHEAFIEGSVGDLVSLIPAGGSATGVTTGGLRWILEDADLTGSATRGISNEMVGDSAEVRVANGTLLVVHERSSS